MKNKQRIYRKIRAILVIGLLCVLSGCATKAADTLNPFSEEGGEGYGNRNSNAILGEGAGVGQDEKARHALEVMGSYQRTLDPSPARPVMNPAVVRLMWVPDHLNSAGDLVPAHYYYLKVRDDYWAVQDAFDMEKQLHESGSDSSSATPWVFKTK